MYCWETFCQWHILHEVTTHTCSADFHPVPFTCDTCVPFRFLFAPLVLWCPFHLFSFSFLSAQYGAEFRRFSVDRVKPGKFEEFYKLLLHIHRIANMEMMIGYADVHGDLLPINNDDNFCKAVSTAHPLLRIFIQRQGKINFKKLLLLFVFTLKAYWVILY